MYESNNFDGKEMMTWEDDDNQTWVHLQTYFGELWEKKQRYGGTTTKATGFGESAANITKQNGVTNDTLQHIAHAATADKEHIQQMSNAHDDLLSVVKKQQSQIDELVKQNGHLTTLLSKVDILGKTMATNATVDDKKTIPSNKVKRGGGNNRKCKICGDFHSTEFCWELETNKARHPDGWKSRVEKKE